MKLESDIVKKHFIVIDSWAVHDQAPAMFPGLARASNGDFLLAFSTMPDGLPGGQVQIMRSVDGGREWSKVKDLVGASKRKAGTISAGGLTVLSDGTLLLPYNEVELHGGYDDRDVALFLLRSKDDGNTWSEPSRVAAQFHEPCAYGKIIERPDGTLLWPIWGQYRKGEHWRSGLLKSNDGGLIWDEYITIAYDPEARMSGAYVFSRVSGFDQEGNFDEAMLAHPDFRPHSTVDGFSETSLTLMPDGKILAVLRQQGVENREHLALYCCVSTDGGDTWSQYERMDICGMSPCLHLSPYGCLILAYRRCAATSSLEGKPGVALSWSEDKGMTWQDELVLVDPSGYQYTGEYQAGYPTLINVDSDDILVIFYSYNPLPPQRRYLAANLIREIG